MAKSKVVPLPKQKEVMRVRVRTNTFKFDNQKIVDRVDGFFNDDMTDRDVDRDARLQRYAKFRMWTENAEGPWVNSSDQSVSDMMEKSLRMQDTLNNAALAQRPAIVSQAVAKIDAGKQTTVDNLLDYQFFEEGRGEKLIGDLAEAFINDGVYTVFVPWIKDSRIVSDVRVLQTGIPDDQFPPDFFVQILRTMMRTRADAVIKAKGNTREAWDYLIEFKRPDESTGKIEAGFYTRDDGRVEIVLKGDLIVFDGPLPRCMAYDDVFHPVRCENLQPPGPANPKGAGHVIFRDYPSKDEITRLFKQGYYDQITQKDIDGLVGVARAAGGIDDGEDQQKDDLAGKRETATTASDPEKTSHDTLTRLICFDRYDVDGDGLDEDVIWWYFPEWKKLAKAKILQEMYPSLRPEAPRPLAEASCFPVAGRRVGISFLEILEGLHDMIKILLDQSIDANQMAIIPFGFYRPTSSMTSQTIALRPGVMYPVGDPSRDFNFPQVGNPQAQGFALNLMTLLQQMGERALVQGDLQLGRVPAGRATALRTVGGINALVAQGDARPERLLRRFFGGVAEIYRVMHDLNQYHLPKNKQIRIAGTPRKYQDPYSVITDLDKISGRFQFKFTANAFNTSKQMLQQTMQTLVATLINPLMIQLGVTNAETVFNLARDFVASLGVDPVEKGYINEPIPGYGMTPYFAEEVMSAILQGQMPPDGRAAEEGGWTEHLQRLQELEEQLVSDKEDTGEISEQQAQIFQQYKAMAAQKAALEQQQQQMQANAAAFQQGGQQGQPGRPAEQPPPDASSNPQVSSGNELLDETLPGARGVAA